MAANDVTVSSHSRNLLSWNRDIIGRLNQAQSGSATAEVAPSRMPGDSPRERIMIGNWAESVCLILHWLPSTDHTGREGSLGHAVHERPDCLDTSVIALLACGPRASSAPVANTRSFPVGT